jgi:hypothetical protein
MSYIFSSESWSRVGDEKMTSTSGNTDRAVLPLFFRATSVSGHKFGPGPSGESTRFPGHAHMKMRNAVACNLYYRFYLFFSF